ADQAQSQSVEHAPDRLDDRFDDRVDHAEDRADGEVDVNLAGRVLGVDVDTVDHENRRPKGQCVHDNSDDDAHDVDVPMPGQAPETPVSSSTSNRQGPVPSGGPPCPVPSSSGPPASPMWRPWSTSKWSRGGRCTATSCPIR